MVCDQKKGRRGGVFKNTLLLELLLFRPFEGFWCLIKAYAMRRNFIVDFCVARTMFVGYVYNSALLLLYLFLREDGG